MGKKLSDVYSRSPRTFKTSKPLCPLDHEYIYRTQIFNWQLNYLIIWNYSNFYSNSLLAYRPLSINREKQTPQFTKGTPLLESQLRSSLVLIVGLWFCFLVRQITTSPSSATSTSPLNHAISSKFSTTITKMIPSARRNAQHSNNKGNKEKAAPNNLDKMVRSMPKTIWRFLTAESMEERLRKKENGEKETSLAGEDSISREHDAAEAELEWMSVSFTSHLTFPYLRTDKLTTPQHARPQNGSNVCPSPQTASRGWRDDSRGVRCIPFSRWPLCTIWQF